MTARPLVPNGRAVTRKEKALQEVASAGPASTRVTRKRHGLMADAEEALVLGQRTKPARHSLRPKPHLELPQLPPPHAGREVRRLQTESGGLARLAREVQGKTPSP